MKDAGFDTHHARTRINHGVLPATDTLNRDDHSINANSDKVASSLSFPTIIARYFIELYFLWNA
ncbi:MAG: hypothetical protein CMO03_04200 [Thalassospira sp.]|uniref:Uncharacterized protein n=1 Tax=Thalassospira xiamenensis TaxID=220697 RepID=A0ABR5Y198_9PROT|nr:hypothetical protein AUP40_18915 [Thalassospira xiamenensis]KZD08457.1 hypothetical protein AUP45_16215 [Thalassospira xiamenensis]MAL28713.1 hypothetical protein [Thalassospira sp.]HBN51819.1 hypothetical protein [Thalassospira sp.]